MNVRAQDGFERDWFSKPGDSLRSLLQRRRLPASDLAERFAGGMAEVRGIMDGSLRIDQARADILAAAVGGSCDFWMKRQASYEQALEQAVSAAMALEIEEWLDRVPAPGAKPRGPFTAVKQREELKRRLAFFNVANLSVWEARYGSVRQSTRFRTSASFSSNDGAVFTWLRRGELEADLISTERWSPDLLRNRLPEIRKLTRLSQPARFLPKLKQLCAEAGVALVVARTPNGCHASGASRMVAPDKAMILLSFRFRSDDHFWFTVFHEIGHLLLHNARSFVDDDATSEEDDCEREANDFASSCLIPEEYRRDLERLKPEMKSVLRFSLRLGISPGITVGQLQHRNIIERNRLNSLKRRWTWDEIEAAIFTP